MKGLDLRLVGLGRQAVRTVTGDALENLENSWYPFVIL